MSLEGIELHLVDSVEEAGQLMTWLSTVKSEDVGFDTETTGLSPERDHVRLVQVGDGQKGWAIPFERWGGVAEEVIERWCGDGKRLTMHNAPFDVAMMDGEGIRIPRHLVDDTRLMGHVIEPTQSTALKNQASRHVDKRAGTMQRALDDIIGNKMENGDKIGWDNFPIVADGPLAVYWQYGAIDPILTYQLKRHHYPNVQAEAPRAYELELATSWVVERMQRRGTRIDREYTQARSDEFLRYVEEVAAWTEKTYGIKPGSNADVIKVLERETGYKFTQRTDGGALSLDKVVISDVIARTAHPLAGAVLGRRQAQKAQSTYLRRFLEFSQYDGFLHPSINSIGGSGKKTGATEGAFGVRTARMSMDTPNLQQLPRKGTNVFGDEIRNCIVPREGHTLIMCDFDQIEMRGLAHLAADPGMIAAFMTDDDFFTTMARIIYQDQSIVKKDPRRQTTKNGHYAIAYGAGLDKFALTAGITPGEADQFLTTLHTMFPGIRQFQRKVESTAMERLRDEGLAYVKSPLTGRRHVADPGREYALVNYLIQGMAAELFKMKLCELDAAGLGPYMILPVHDEVILDVPNDDVNDVLHVLYSVMNDFTMLSVPITAGLATGTRWGAKQDLDESSLAVMP